MTGAGTRAGTGAEAGTGARARARAQAGAGAGIAPEGAIKPITIVIPGRDCAQTIGPCLSALVPLLAGPLVERIVFVDDGSRDTSAAVAAGFGVEVVRGAGRGAGAARNLGWRRATTPWVWFVDSDCVAEPDALPQLWQHLQTAPRPETIAAVGGSYANLRPHSLLASLIHEEIVARHAQMPDEVGTLATFNVLYRTEVLQTLGGFDERFYKGQDAELAYRVRDAGWRLRFCPASRVGHFHLDQLAPYLRVQRQQGYWRAWLVHHHPGHATGDSYAGKADAVAPVLALAMLGLLPWATTPQGAAAEGALGTALLGSQLPRARELVERTGDERMWAFAPMGAARAFARGIGLAHGAAAVGLQVTRDRWLAAHRLGHPPRQTVQH